MASYKEKIFNNFNVNFPLTAKQSVEWKVTGPSEITVELSDGTKIIYDDFDKTLINIDYTSGPMTEQQWKNEFGRRLNKRLYLSGVSQQELADRIGVTRQLVGRYVNGSSVPNPLTIRAIARVLNCDISDLIDF